MSDTREPIPGATPIKTIESPSSNPYVEKYGAQAEEKNIKHVSGGDWLVVDGMEYTHWGDEKSKLSTNTDPDNFERRIAQVGCYDTNNSTLAYVDELGIMHVGHATYENLEALEKAGYSHGGIGVPFSNGETPSDPELRQQYVELREKGREANKQRAIQEHLHVYSQIAERKGIKPVDGGIFMMVDGIEHGFSDNETGRVDVNTDGYNMAIRRTGQLGTYCSNNGVIAFVDHQGKMWVGASTEENRNSLQRAGYESGGIWVPFSNGEMPTDRTTYEQLRDVLTGKPADQLRAERDAKVEEIINERRELFEDIAIIPDKNDLFGRVANETEKEYINTEKLIAERLHPKIERDNAGYERRVYTINGITFSFKGREELPNYATLTSSSTTFLGEAPNWTEVEDYQKWQEQLQLTQTQESSPQHYVANKTLLGVVDLAVQLGSKDTSLVQLKAELSKGVYSKRALTLIDALVATNFVNFVGFRGNKTDINAEAVVLLSFLGDTDAQTAVAEAVDTLRRIDQNRKINREVRKVDYEPLKPQDLVCVHATRYKPVSTEDGGVFSSYDLRLYGR